MVTIGMNYETLPGKRGEFVAVFEKVLKVMQDIDGHVESGLYSNEFADNQFLIVSQWDDESAFDAFIASDRFRNVADWGKENVLAGRPSHQVYGGAKAETPPPGCPAHRP